MRSHANLSYIHGFCDLTSQFLPGIVVYMTTQIPRHIHLIDIENLAGTPLPTTEQVAEVRSAYQRYIEHGDHVVLACSHKAYATVGWAWPDARHLLRSGEDGADLALLEVLDTERVAERYDCVFVGSGDGIFAGPTAALGGQGVPVTVVSRPESLSRRLEMAALETFPFSSGTRPTIPMHQPPEAA